MAELKERKPVYMKLEPGSVVYKGDEAFIIVSLLDTQSVLAKQPDSYASTRLMVSDLLPEPESKIEKMRKNPGVDVSNDKDWKIAQKRFQIIQPLLNTPKFFRKTDDVAARAKEFNLGTSTVYRWLDHYESSGLVTSLMPNERNDKGKSRISPEIEKIIESCINDVYLTAQKKKTKAVFEEVARRCKADGISPPHPNTVRNRIAALPEKLKMSKRHGKKTAAQKFSPDRGGFPDATWPLEVVQMDHTQLDIILVDDIFRRPIGRPWITLAIDVYSRMIAGLFVSFEPPGALAAGLCVAHAMLSKDKWLAERDINSSWPIWGKMDRLHMDNAKEFRGRMLENACKEYGVHIEWRPVKRPNYGGHVERVLGTIAKKIHELPGTTFSSPKSRNNYNSDKKASLSFSEFETWLAVYITDVYHQTIHKGIGTTPLKKYEEGILGNAENPGRGLPTRIVDEQRLKLDFTPLIERSIQTYGVVIDEIHYFHDVLTPWVNSMDPEQGRRKRQFIFKRDPRDISVIYFYDPDLKEYFSIPYRDISRPVISLWELRETKNFLKSQGVEEVNEDVIFSGYERMREIEEKAVKRTRKSRRNNQRRMHASGIHDNRERSVVRKSEVKADKDDFDFANITPFEEIEEM